MSHEISFIIRHHVGPYPVPSSRNNDESRVFLEEIAYIFLLALLRMIDGNTYHNGHSYGAPL